MAADFGSNAVIQTFVAGSEETRVAAECAAACDQVFFGGCVAFLWSEGVACELYPSEIVSLETITPMAGTFYYRKNPTSVITPNPGYLADGVSLAGPGTCGCPSATLPQDRCVVLCESSSDSTCVRVPDEQVDDGFAVLIKTGAGACRGAGGVNDRPQEDLTEHTVATPAECMALCTTAHCYGVSIQTLAAEQLNDDVCETSTSAACELADTDEPTCVAASTGDSPCTYDSASGTCAAAPDVNCEGATADACEAAGRCTLRSDPANAFLCEVWDKVLLRSGAKVRATEVSSSDEYVPIRPMHRAADGSGQCWIPQHVAHMCEVPAGDAVTTVSALTNGAVMESCAEGEFVPLGQQTCIVCDAFHGPDPETSDAVCNPRYEVDRSAWFQAGDVQCMPECADNEEQLSECREWASKDECRTNPDFMDMNCPLSCRTWLKEVSVNDCIEPMDPDEAILRCAPCPTIYYDGFPYTCASGNALDVPQCRAYGFSTRTQSMSPVARVYIEDQGWRDMPLGPVDANEYLNRCEDMRLGPNFGQLGVPIPPNSVASADRYTVDCEIKRKECTSYHRSSRDDCDGENEYYLTLRLNFFMDCGTFMDSGETPAEGCRASENYQLDGKAGYPPRYCNRGQDDPENPPHGFHWSIPLCKTTPECLVAGAAVLSDPDSLEVFRRDCCMLTTAVEVEDGPDGSTTMRDLCSSATSGAARATVPSWLRLVGAAFAALMVHSHAIR